jgi:ribosomal-protein-alanine N-acetyltransferase
VASTDELVFRTWRSTDVESLVKYANNKNVWMNLKDRFPHPYTADDAEDWIGMNHVLVGPPVNFAIELKGEAIGGVGLELLEDVLEQTANIGYWLGEPFWGRGIATAAVQFATDYGFETFPLNRLQAGVFDWNPASARVLEKAGYQPEGRLRRAIVKDGRIGDLLLFGRVRR